MSKHVTYVGLADRRAQGIITINAFLIPISLTGSQNPLFYNGAIIAVITGLISISSAIYSLYPKQYGDPKNAHRELLHFSQIRNLSETKYMELMNEALADLGKLSEMVARDLYHLSTRVLAPKFLWLKISYFSFFLGNLIAVASIAIQSA